MLSSTNLASILRSKLPRDVKVSDPVNMSFHSLFTGLLLGILWLIQLCRRKRFSLLWGVQSEPICTVLHHLTSLNNVHLALFCCSWFLIRRFVNIILWHLPRLPMKVTFSSLFFVFECEYHDTCLKTYCSKTVNTGSLIGEILLVGFVS